jgi:ribonucleoside-diphosphate reductase alpha chain
MADHPELAAPTPTPGRRRLPNRRAHEVREIEYGGIRYQVGFGRFADGEVAEVFMNVSGKVGTDLDAHARDAAITASIALQFGAPLDVLRRALTRVGNGGPGSALSYALGLIAAEIEGAT